MTFGRRCKSSGKRWGWWRAPTDAGTIRHARRAGAASLRAPTERPPGGSAMSLSLCSIIASEDPAVRDTPLDAWARDASVADLMLECEGLDRFRRESDNLYHRVRALFFLYAIHRFLLPPKLEQGGAAGAAKGVVPFEGYS